MAAASLRSQKKGHQNNCNNKNNVRQHEPFLLYERHQNLLFIIALPSRPFRFFFELDDDEDLSLLFHLINIFNFSDNFLR